MRAALSIGAFIGFLSLIGCGGSGSSPTPTPTQAATTTTLTASPNPATAGATVTLTANVTSSGGTPTGTVTFFDGTATLGIGTLTNGAATLTTSTLAAGATHSLTASYAATTNFGGSTSAAVSLAVNAAATTTTLTASPNPAAAGAAVTLTASVTSSNGTPTGTVTFLDGTTALGTGTLNASGVATLTTSTLAAGATHTLTASYAATTNFAGSTSAAVSLVVNAAATTTTLTASPNPAAAGATVTLTASVTSSGGTPTGTVMFLDGTTSLGTGTLNSSGVATLTTSTLAAGATHSLTASYAASGSFAASTSSAVSLVVNTTATTTTLTASPNPAAPGATVTLTATVTSSSGTPAGTVTFFDGTTSLGTGTLTNGVATLTTTTLAAGATHSLTASYAASGSFAASISAAVSEVVNSATTTTLTASPNPATQGATVTLTATVTSSGGTPTGTVTFIDGTTSLGTGTLTSGMATLTTTTLAAGATHSLTASYAASGSFAASTSAAVSLVVSPSTTASATFGFSTPHQTIAGFGGAEAFYANYLDSHPNESQIMSALFDPVNGLGITFLRLENNYYEYTGSNISTFDTDDAKILTGATNALGAKPTVLMSSWTPPASLKSNNSVNGCTGVTNGNCTSGFGTLKQVSGAYDYTDFGQFWLSSLQAYANLGVVPDYISIQNEPDYPATYVGCLFNPTETPADLYGPAGTQSYASYGKAFDATYQAINTSGALTSVPKMIGPEAFALSDVQPLLTEVPANELAVVAHHLYNVSSYGGDPTGQVSPMSALASDYPTQMKWETEYFQTPGFYNAIDIHNALTVANDNVYLYWALAWPSTLSNGVSTDQQGLLYIDNPFNSSSTWAYPNGWTYNDAYYAMKGYSYYIRPGYIRYTATSNNADEDVSVFQSPDAKTTVIVVLNVSTTSTDNLTLDLSSITYTGSTVYRSSFNTPITTTGAERWNNLGAYTSAGISLPPESEVTVVLTQ